MLRFWASHPLIWTKVVFSGETNSFQSLKMKKTSSDHQIELDHEIRSKCTWSTYTRALTNISKRCTFSSQDVLEV